MFPNLVFILFREVLDLACKQLVVFHDAVGLELVEDREIIVCLLVLNGQHLRYLQSLRLELLGLRVDIIYSGEDLVDF